RMVAAAPNSPDALRHRAYAFALAGLQGAALEDLDRAEKLDKNPAAAPAWVALLRPYCRYQTSKLANLAGGADNTDPIAPLARLPRPPGQVRIRPPHRPRPPRRTHRPRQGRHRRTLLDRPRPPDRRSPVRPRPAPLRLPPRRLGRRHRRLHPRNPPPLPE